MRKQLISILWQGVLLAIPVLLLAGGTFWGWYRLSWEHDQRWEEAVRHWYRPHMMIERWLRFRWIHPDCLYWIVHVDFAKGDIALVGEPTEALYWSFTWYEGTEVNASVSSQSVALEPDGSYRIDLSVEERGQNWLPVREDAGKSVIYFRIYEPAHLYPSKLPDVVQDGEVLVYRSGA